ncbi:MAG: DUF99 family protein [Candidatus Schekmanbacteria bacterium]|nr:DUF99 family protein [Candidatus Schekmanbacteria bacterium]
MAALGAILARNGALRAIGFDDAPFQRGRKGDVGVAGVVCSGTRFEGMVWGRIRQDGWNATDRLLRLLCGGKFLPQLHLVLLDGLNLGGFNVVDLPRLAAETGVPCVAVMRRRPDLEAIDRALQRLPRVAERRRLLARGGPLYGSPPRVFQVSGAGPVEVEAALARLTDRGHVPEALRLAHLIGSAVVRGESSRRA